MISDKQPLSEMLVALGPGVFSERHSITEINFHRRPLRDTFTCIVNRLPTESPVSFDFI